MDRILRLGSGVITWESLSERLRASGGALVRCVVAAPASSRWFGGTMSIDRATLSKANERDQKRCLGVGSAAHSSHVMGCDYFCTATIRSIMMAFRTFRKRRCSSISMQNSVSMQKTKSNRPFAVELHISRDPDFSHSSSAITTGTSAVIQDGLGRQSAEFHSRASI